jgi:uncharacterized lipoprotein YddW (UPF0748 family)
MKRIALALIPLLVLSVSALMVVRQTAAPIPLGVAAPTKEALSAAPLARRHGQETRALWIVRFTLTSPEAIRASVKRAKESGFTDLVVQVRGRGDAFYRSQWEPRAEELAGQPPEFDPLAAMIEEAHARGMRVHAWINTYLVANVEKLPGLPEHIIYKNPEWLMAPRPLARQLYGMDPKAPEYLAKLREYTLANRKFIEGLFVSPSHPAVKEHLKNIWLDVLSKYDVDGLHFDYVRYPNFNFDYSRGALERFRAELEVEFSAKDKAHLAALAAKNPLVYATTFPERFAKFQRNHVTELVSSLYTAVKSQKREVEISAAVAANADEGFRWRYQDWRAWMKLGILDIVCPMAYTTNTKVFEQQMLVALNSANGHPVWGGIGSWRQPVSGTLEKIQVTRRHGAQGFILFSYDSAVQFSDLNPQKDYLERLHSELAFSAK